MEERENSEASQDYRCPLSHQVMFDPVVASDGETYEREMIEKHFETCKNQRREIMSPLHNTKMDERLVPNQRMLSNIKEFMTKHPEHEGEIYFSQKIANQCVAAAIEGDVQKLKEFIPRDKRLLMRPLMDNKKLIDIASEKSNPGVLKFIIEELNKHKIPLPPSINAENLLLKKRVESLENFNKSAIKFFQKNLKPKIKTLESNSKIFANVQGEISALELFSNNVVSGFHDGSIKILDINSGKCIKTFGERHTDRVTCLHVSLDESLLASGGGNKDKTIKIWGINSGKRIQILQGHAATICALHWLKNGWLASGAADSTIKIWDIDSGKCVKTLTGHNFQVFGLQLLSDGRLISCAWDRVIKVWDVNSGQCLKTIGIVYPNPVTSPHGHDGGIGCIHLLQNGLVASGSQDKTVKIWNIETGQCVQTLWGHSGDHVMAVLPLSKKYLISVSESMKIWDTSSGQCIQTLNVTGTAPKLLPDGRLIIGVNGQIKSWAPLHLKLELTSQEVNKLQEKAPECRMS